MAHHRLIMRERVTAFAGAALLLCLVGLTYYYSIQSTLTGLRYVPSKTSPDFSATGVTITDFDEAGRAKQKIFASTVDHFSDDRLLVSKVHYLTLDPTKAQLQATADKVWSEDGLETVELSGNIRIHQAAKDQQPETTFTTDFLRGWLDTQRFETDHPVSIQRGLDTLDAQKGMTYDNTLHTLELHDNIRTILHPRSDKGNPTK